MAPTITVTYFNIRGLGETIRLLLKYGDIEFEDKRLTQEEWATQKEKAPFGQMPLYEEDGKVAWQSISICRYLAKKVKLTGANDWENLEIDAMADTITDFRLKLSALAHEKDDEKKKQIKEILIKETGPFYLGKLDKIAGENNGHLVAKKLTWVDFYFFNVSHITTYFFGPDELSKYPNLQAVCDNVGKIPAIAKWTEIRPKSDF